jgi:hypothetical protein
MHAMWMLSPPRFFHPLWPIRVRRHVPDGENIFIGLGLIACLHAFFVRLLPLHQVLGVHVFRICKEKLKDIPVKSFFKENVL